MELTEEQKITMAVAYGRMHEAEMQRAAEECDHAIDAMGECTREESLGGWISYYNRNWRKLTGFRPHHEEFAEVNG